MLKFFRTPCILYEDFRIILIKNISNDRIAIMISYSNLVSNILNGINIDVNDLTNKVRELSTEMIEVKKITDSLQKS